MSVKLKLKKIDAAGEKFLKKELLEDRPEPIEATEKELKLARLFYRRLGQGREARERFDYLWKFFEYVAEGYKLDSFDLNDDDVRETIGAGVDSWKQALFIYNIAYKFLQTIRAHLLDSMPVPQAKPKHAKYSDIGDQVDALLQFINSEYDMIRTVADCVVSCGKKGIGVSKIFWDYNIGPRRIVGIDADTDEPVYGGRSGDLRIMYKPPEDIYFPPGEKDPRLLRWIIDLRYDHLLDIEEKYDRGKYVQPSTREDGIKVPGWVEQGLSEGTDLSGGGEVAQYDRGFRGDPNVPAEDDRSEHAVIGEMWCQDDTVEPMQVVGEEMSEYRARFPNGRLSVLGSGIVLYDGPAPVNDAGSSHAYEMLALDPYEGEIYGRSIIPLCARLQDYVDETIELIVDNMRTTGADRVQTPRKANLEERGGDGELTNVTGRVWEYDDGEIDHEPKVIQGTPIDFSKAALVDKLAEWGEDVLGVLPALQGKSEYSGESGIHSERNRASASVRINERRKYLDRFIIGIASAALDIIAEHWDEGRQFIVHDAEGNRVEKQYSGVMRDWRQYVDLEVQSGLNLSEEAQAKIVMELRTLGAITDEETVREIPGLKNKAAILRRIRQDFIGGLPQEIARLLEQSVDLQMVIESLQQSLQVTAQVAQQMMQEAQAQGGHPPRE